MQSSVFGGGYVDQEPIKHDREVFKSTYGSNADWKTGNQKPKNLENIDAF